MLLNINNQMNDSSGIFISRSLVFKIMMYQKQYYGCIQYQYGVLTLQRSTANHLHFCHDWLCWKAWEVITFKDAVFIFLRKPDLSFSNFTFLRKDTAELCQHTWRGFFSTALGTGHCWRKDNKLNGSLICSSAENPRFLCLYCSWYSLIPKGLI